jgi:hypothetical protein
MCRPSRLASYPYAYRHFRTGLQAVPWDSALLQHPSNQPGTSVAGSGCCIDPLRALPRHEHGCPTSRSFFARCGIPPLFTPRLSPSICKKAGHEEPALSLSNGDGTTCSPPRKCRVCIGLVGESRRDGTLPNSHLSPSLRQGNMYRQTGPSCSPMVTKVLHTKGLSLRILLPT